MVELNRLFDLDQLARQAGRRYPRCRALFDVARADQGRHFTGIVGPRGVGKTILLRQLAGALDQAFYLSADTLAGADLFEVARQLQEKYGIRVLLVDEVHFQRDYPQALKKVYDFLSLRVLFTSSVSLALFESSTDLSRRVRLLPLYPFSFREFVLFKTGTDLPGLTLAQIHDRQWTPEHLRCEYLFEEYLQGGLMPFALEDPDVLPLLRNVVAKVIGADIPAVARLTIDELPRLHQCLEFIGRAAVDGINYSSLSRNVGITKYKAEAYVRLLERAFILNPVFPAGTNVLREPKVLMALPYRRLFGTLSAGLGGLREDFFAEAMRMRGLPFHYLKSTRGQKTPDYLVKAPEGELVVEIGGKGKGRSQFKGLALNKSLILCQPAAADGLRRPLFLLGFH